MLTTRLAFLLCLLAYRGTAPASAADAAEFPEAFVVAKLILKKDDVRKELLGHTLVNQGLWPFRVHIGEENRFRGIWALDEKGDKTVRVDGAWRVKGDQICIVDDGRDKEVCRFIALIGERVLIFDEVGELAYTDVVRTTGDHLEP